MVAGRDFIIGSPAFPTRMLASADESRVKGRRLSLTKGIRRHKRPPRDHRQPARSRDRSFNQIQASRNMRQMAAKTNQRTEGLRSGNLNLALQLENEKLASVVSLTLLYI